MSLITEIKTFTFKIDQHKKSLFLLLTILIGIITLWPLHNFQYYIAQGDHGRDLYCFKKTMEGSLPYRDFSWLFGPLMPYYYSVFYHLFGVSIQSVLLGQNLLILLAGILIYLICCTFISPTLSFTCAVWYWGFRGAEFFYTYNHIGALCALLATLYLLFRYINESKIFHVYFGSLNLFLLMLIRPNMGITTLIAFFSCLCIADFIKKEPNATKNRRIYVYLTFGLLAIPFLIYWYLLHPVPKYVISQSFPFSKSQRADYSQSIIDALFLLWNMIITYFRASWPRKILATILLLSLIQTIILFIRNKFPKKLKDNLILVFISLFIFMLFTLHEYIASGVYYRFIWIIPLLLITLFYLIDTGTKNILSPIIHLLIFITFLLPPLLQIENKNSFIQLMKNPEHSLEIGKNKIYTFQNPVWFKTVRKTTQFIRQNVPENEKVFVVPFDPLYLFLAERDSASRQLIFFEHFNIPEEQERSVLAEIENQKVNWVIFSNRSDSVEPGMGTFGKTYCPLIADYLNKHFKIEIELGDWENPPGWAWNHGVRILKRVR